MDYSPGVERENQLLWDQVAQSGCVDVNTEVLIIIIRTFFLKNNKSEDTLIDTSGHC